MASAAPSAARRGDGIPSSLLWAYEASLNRQADLLFWAETNYKPNQKLDPTDPRDRAMVPTWWAARSRVAQTRSPRELIRQRAVETVLDMRQNDPQPVFVHAIGPGGSETRAFPSLHDRRGEDYFRARLRESSYVALFNADDARWPQPVYERYSETEHSAPAVSGEIMRGRYENEVIRWRRRR